MPPALVLAAALAAAPPPAGPEPPVDEAAIRRLLADGHGLDRAGIAAAGGYGPAAFPLYHRILGGPDKSTWVVGRTLFVLADPDMKGDKAPFLDRAAALLTHPHIRPRLEAIRLIGAIGSARDAPPVVAMLWDERSEVTYAAAKALAAVGDRRAADALEVWLKRADHRGKEATRRQVEGFRADLLGRLKKEEDARKAQPPAK